MSYIVIYYSILQLLTVVYAKIHNRGVAEVCILLLIHHEAKLSCVSAHTPRSEAELCMLQHTQRSKAELCMLQRTQQYKQLEETIIQRLKPAAATCTTQPLSL